MIAAIVTGSLWATRRIDGVPTGAFLEVEVPGTGSTLIAFDVLGSGVGEHVLVVQGSVASNWFSGPPPPIDALVIGSIDQRPDTSQASQSATLRPPSGPDRLSPTTQAQPKRSSNVQ